eukprot:gene10869-22693_t
MTICSADFKKGDTVLKESTGVFVKTDEDMSRGSSGITPSRVFNCGHCCNCVDLNIPSENKANTDSLRVLPGHAISYQSFPCENTGCKVQFCSENCRENAVNGSHQLICTGGSSPMYSEFSRYCAQSHHIFLLAAKLLSTFITKSFYSSCHGIEEEQLEESWTLLRAALIYEKNVPPDILLDISLSDWMELIRVLLIGTRTIEIESPMAALAIALPTMSHEMRALGVDYLRPYVDSVMSKDAPTTTKTTTTTGGGAREEKVSSTSTLTSTSTQPLDRCITRLAEAAASQCPQRNPFDASSSRFAVLLLPTISLLPHSCVPNVQYEVITNDNDHAKDKMNYSQGIVVRLVALRDLKAGERIGRTVFEREELLKPFLISSCGCIRCVFEREAGLIPSGFRDIDRGVAALTTALHPQAMQEGRPIHAEQLYDLLISLQMDNGDYHHGKGAALLEQGDCISAHTVWRRGFALAPQHTLLEAEVCKANAYTYIGGDRPVAITPYPGSDAAGMGMGLGMVPVSPSPLLLPSPYVGIRMEGVPSVFLTRGAVLTTEECLAAVAMAETYAQRTVLGSGGWTTSRHYAVPTTDLPVHVIPDLLSWFNGIMSTRLIPMLLEQFPGEARVNDAFVVKYSRSRRHNTHYHSLSDSVEVTDSPTAVAAGEVSPEQEQEQYYLPVHMDQSTHSFTIALNSVDAYEGGGTYFVDVGRAVRPDIGQVLSFRGDLMHGGEPITSGVRYIIAAFLYISHHKDDDNEHNADGHDQYKRKRNINCTSGSSGSSLHSIFRDRSEKKPRDDESVAKQTVVSQSSFTFSFSDL